MRNNLEKQPSLVLQTCADVILQFSGNEELIEPFWFTSKVNRRKTPKQEFTEEWNSYISRRIHDMWN